VLLVDENIEILGKNSPTCHSSHLDSHGLARDRSPASAVRSRRCMDCTMTLTTTVMTVIQFRLFWKLARDYSEDQTKSKNTAFGKYTEFSGLNQIIQIHTVVLKTCSSNYLVLNVS